MPLMHFTIQLEYRGLSRIGRALTAAYGGAPSVRNYDDKKRRLVEAYGERVENAVTKNNGILAFDNWCKAWGCPQLSIQRESALLLSNRTVVGVNAFEFLERPRFKWMCGRTSCSRLSAVMDLKAYEDKVNLAMHFMCSFRV